MSKKMMLFALAVAALFALPSAASAAELHLVKRPTFSGKGGAGFLTAANEPKISCGETKVEGGEFDVGSSTTGKMNLIFTGCTAEFLGIKGSCSTNGTAGEIQSSGTFHLITTIKFTPAEDKLPGILVTPKTTTITCIGFSRVEVTGNGIIGHITKPSCGGSSKELTVAFEAEGSTQKALEYTGVKYDLSADTENSEGKTTGANGTAAITSTVTLTASEESELQCT